MIFRDADCGAIPITDTGKPIGLLTDRDVATRQSPPTNRTWGDCPWANS